MDEQTAVSRHRRKPFVAALLSLVSPGLGHIYCGKIVKGFVLAFSASILVPVISFIVLSKSSRVSIIVIGISLLTSLVIWLAAIIDSYYIARHTRPDYELKEYNHWYVYVIFVLMIASGSNRITMNIKSNLLEAFRMPTGSMVPTIEPKDLFIANKVAYKNVDPQRGDVIVFLSPKNHRETYVQRVVAVEGDSVEIKNKEFHVNGEKLERKSEGRASYHSFKMDMEGELFTEKNGRTEYKIFIADTNDGESYLLMKFPITVVPPQHCFVLGDNREFSYDSKYFGSVPLAAVKGRADYLYWPAKDWSRFGRIK